jgi:hypothetical protein
MNTSKAKQVCPDHIILNNFLREHFCYEVDMLCVSTSFLSYYSVNGHQAGINLALENFLLHSRNIIEFLYLKPKRNYARAHHYLDNDVCSRLFSSKTPRINNILKRANQENAHLTFDRYCGSPPEKKWFWLEDFLELLTKIKVFLDNLPEQYKNDEIGKLYSKILCFESDTKNRIAQLPLKSSVPNNTGKII